MVNEVQKTDAKGEDKAADLDIKALFSPPEVEEVKADKTDVKDSGNPDPVVEDEAAETTDPKELQAKLSALTKELSRVRKSKTESSVEVQEVREQLANLQGQLNVMSKTKGTDEVPENRLAKYTDEQLLQGQTEWEESVTEASYAKRKARTDADDAAYEKAEKAANTAKSTLIAIRKELLERTKRVGAEQAKAQSETSELVQEIAGLYENAYSVLPDLKDKDSELWKAGNEVYNRHTKLMKQLGPMAELVATSIAITENPKLLPGGNQGKAARKDLLKEINDHVETSLIKGKGTPNKKVTTDFAALPKAQFEKLIHDLKQG
jgi:predicted  nucleic acid-binding Zn-ribbon protein